MQALLLPWEGVTWGQAGVLSAALGHKPGSLKCTHQGLPKAFPKLGPYILNPTIINLPFQYCANLLKQFCVMQQRETQFYP